MESQYLKVEKMTKEVKLSVSVNLICINSTSCMNNIWKFHKI